MNKATEEAISKLITSAFSDAVYPGDDALVNHSENHLEKQQIADFFRGRKWKGISLDILHEEYIGDESACLFFMTREAIAYYAPAFMLICLEQYEDADLIPDTVISVLTTPTIGNEDCHALTRWAANFDDRQRMAIDSFLKHMRKKHPEDFGDQMMDTTIYERKER